MARTGTPTRARPRSSGDGYRDRLFIGIDADETVMPDVAPFQHMIAESFAELAAAAGVMSSPRA